MSSDGTWNFVYDNEGNQTEKDKIGSANEKWTYAYDNKDRLTEAKYYNSAGTLAIDAVYKYDVFGNRNEKDVTQSGVTTTTRFAYDGWDPARPTPVGTENFDIWATFDGTGSLTNREFHGDGVDQAFAYINSG